MRFTVLPRLLDHFGIAMYNTIPKAIAELVANAYDADATGADITYTKDEISIVDDGRGMTTQELEEDYLRLGRDRREDGDTAGETTPKGRAVIGNKGIGKLAGFGIAQTMTVRTWRDGTETTIAIDRTKLDTEPDLEAYEFEPLVKKRRKGDHGTEIHLTELLADVALTDETRLRAYLARQLPGQVGWKVSVNGVECTPDDIPGQRFPFNDPVPGFGHVSGYYIVATDRRGLEPGFAVRVRGRVVQDTSLFGLNQQTHGFFNLVRIVGELNPDFIDPVQGTRSSRDSFVINTSRSGFNPEDPGVQALNAFAVRKLETIATGLAQVRIGARKAAALSRNPKYDERLKALGPEVYAKLDEAIGQVISTLSKNEEDDTVDRLVDLIIRYYESDALRVILDTIRTADPGEVERLSRLLAQYGAARVAEVTDLLHTQLEIIELLRTKVADGVLEAEIHTIIADNIWLVRDDLTYWFSNKAFATQLGDRLAARFTYAQNKRPDLVCYDDRPLRPKAGDSARRLVVVEFKRPGVTVGIDELSQVMQYKSVFAATLTQIPPDGIDVIILGDSFDPAFDRAGLREQYVVMSYVELLANARDRYRELYNRLAPDGRDEDDDIQSAVSASAVALADDPIVSSPPIPESPDTVRDQPQGDVTVV